MPISSVSRDNKAFSTKTLREPLFYILLAEENKILTYPVFLLFFVTSIHSLWSWPSKILIAEIYPYPINSSVVVSSS